MQFKSAFIPSGRLPLKGHLVVAHILTVVITIGMSIASVTGLLFANKIYPTDNLLQSFLTNDAVNLIFGLPILLGSLWLARRGQLVGLFFWPGALLYVFYNYTAYVFGMPLGWITFLNAALVLLSAFAVFEILRNIDHPAVKAQLAEVVPVKFSSWVLIGYGVMFIGIAANLMVNASMNQVALPISDIGLVIADSILSMLLIVGGVLWLRRLPVGVAGGAGLLFAATALFIRVILVLVLRPFLTDALFDITEIIVLFVMSSFSFIALGLFTRGVLSAS